MATQQRFILPTQQEVTASGDELWVRANGSRLTIDSMHEEHAKNALRKIVRMARLNGELPLWMQQAIEQTHLYEDQSETPSINEEENDLVQRLRGRARFIQESGSVKSSGLMLEAAREIERLRGAA